MRLSASLFALLVLAGCQSNAPAEAGEPCNPAAEGTDGCDSLSVCGGGFCHALCESDLECEGSRCVPFTSAFGDPFLACEDARAGTGGSADMCCPDVTKPYLCPEQGVCSTHAGTFERRCASGWVRTDC